MNSVFSKENIRALNEVFNMGAWKVADSLNLLSGKEVKVNFSGLEIEEFENVRSIFGREEEIVILLLFGLSGDIGGTLFLKLDMNTTMDLLKKVLNRETDSDNFSEIEISALKSIGNMLCSSFINVLGDMSKLATFVSPPAFAQDYAGAILDQILMVQGVHSDNILLVKMDLLDIEGKKFNAELYFIPLPGDLKKMIKAINKKKGFFSRLFG